MQKIIKLKSKASKYQNQKWINSNDGITLFISVSEFDIHVTIWDTEEREQVIDTYKEAKTTVKKF